MAKNVYPQPEYPTGDRHSRGYFQKYVIAELWRRVHMFSKMREIEDPLQAGLTELQLENVFLGLEPGQISAKLRAMDEQGRIKLHERAYIWQLGPKELKRIDGDNSP